MSTGNPTVTDAKLTVLLVDDEPTIRLSVGDALTAAGHAVTLASDGAQALALLGSRVFDLVITDIRLPKTGGLEIFGHIREHSPSTRVILITAFGSVSDAVGALKDGADDYLTKPFDIDELLVRVERIASRQRLEQELLAARRALDKGDDTEDIIGNSPAMARLKDRIRAIADSDANVLVLGESGTGKELVARCLHRLSTRRERPFVAVNCAAFPEQLLEAELFGHERGAFTGAIRRREGRFKTAHTGTVLLDEVGEIPLPAQAKLLRVLEAGSIEPLGSDRPVTVDVRILAATHRDLRERVARGTFREDLFYRLRVLDITLPPLRERHGDLPLLVEHFVRRHAGDTQRIAPGTWAALSAHPFPGNVRELEHAVHHAIVLARGGVIQVDHLPAEILGDSPGSAAPNRGQTSLSTALKEFEREYILRALASTNGKRGAAAERLGISRKTLWEKMRSHDITDDHEG